MTSTTDQHIVTVLLDRMHGGDETAMGYSPDLDLKRYSVPDNLPRSAPTPYYASSYRKVPVYAQQGSTCVGNSIAAALTHSAHQESDEIVSFDGEAFNARVTHKFDTPISFGPVLDDILKSGYSPLSDQGVYFLKGYANVDWRDHEAVRNAVSTPGQMCVFACQITKAFGSSPTAPLAASSGEPGMGLHAMLLVGYTDDGVVVQNNWGSWWGDSGHCILSWDYVDTHFVEIVAITDQVDVAGGYVKTHQFFGQTEEGIKRTDLPGRKRPAVYLVKTNGLIWITDPWQAKRFGVDLHKLTIVPDTDQRWALPVIGPDAPKIQR